MKRIAIAVLMCATVSPLFAARLQQANQRVLRPNAARRSLVENAVLGFYVKQFQQSAEMTPEVFAKVLPFLQQFVQDRFEISQRRVRTLNQLRQAIAREAGEEELKSLVQQLDAADAEYQANQQKFFSSVDPLLDVRQQAKIRVLQNATDNRIRQMLNQVQNGAAPRGNSAP